MCRADLPAQALIVLGHGKAHFLLHVHAILAGPGLNKGPVKEISIVCDVHTRFHLHNVQSCCVVTGNHRASKAAVQC